MPEPPSLFPVDPPDPKPAESVAPALPPARPRRARRQPAKPDDRAALEEIRRDLLAARALLDELLRLKSS